MSKRSPHPLVNQNDWYFAQYSMKIKAPIYRRAIRGKGVTSKVLNLSSRNVCREALIYNFRRLLKDEFIIEERRDGGQSWEHTLRKVAEGDIDHPALKKPGASWISLNKFHIIGDRCIGNTRRDLNPYSRREAIPGRNVTEDEIENFLRLCDALVGPMTVLLNPDRYVGNWWWTGTQDSLQKDGQLRWYGVDNTMIYHPALLSLYTGMVRQCALLTRTEYPEQILSEVEGMGLEECLNNSDADIALSIVRKLEKWIVVPPPRGGYKDNIPLPNNLNFLLQFHRAIYSHGFEATFGANFLRGWNSDSRDDIDNWEGLEDYLGTGNSCARRRLTALSK